MKLTAHSFEGRLLLALRAGPMANSTLVERFGTSAGASRLVKAGYARRADGDEGGEYHITEAGRAACPYRNPLAAPGAVQPITIKEPTMARENGITRNEVLNAILAAGAHGITRPALVQQFDCAGAEARVDMHTSKLVRERPALVSRPRPGFFIAASHVPAATAAEPIAVESITATTPGDRRGPVVFDDLDIEFAVFSSGRIEISDERNTTIIRGAALVKLRSFLGALA